MHQAPFCAAAGVSTQTTAAKMPRMNTESLMAMGEICDFMVDVRLLP
jgi:hypothetical protein